VVLLKSCHFWVLRAAVTDFDTLELKVGLAARFTAICCVELRWCFADAAGWSAFRTAVSMIGFLTLYMTVLCALYVGFGAEKFTEIFSLVLGVSGIIAANLLGLLCNTFPVVAHGALALHIGTFRLFSLTQLDLILHGSSGPRVPILFQDLDVMVRRQEIAVQII
jgi:hypothetical protein